eukprot:1733843-Rhodomonas_salina.8
MLHLHVRFSVGVAPLTPLLHVQGDLGAAAYAISVRYLSTLAQYASSVRQLSTAHRIAKGVAAYAISVPHTA